ncbi:hypothetical protein Naga_100065g26 [Nannochloropsis gaditana]|uniref:Uncharacterized protein n=1 Tax=Nannochloropsis gaditana TaxID=72520 RepID=W7TM50_9STRA|nr:hypothetical protein Naga_100065g26 [Nannochloropsis gaditana]EWM21805.1 hypothetical protein Naga_100065g26 [Nannochloropsis gaditana]
MTREASAPKEGQGGKRGGWGGSRRTKTPCRTVAAKRFTMIILSDCFRTSLCYQDAIICSRAAHLINSLGISACHAPPHECRRPPPGPLTAKLSYELPASVQ